MKLVFASDSFKGSLSSAHIARMLADAARSSFPDAECVSAPIADGGEGTLDAIAAVRPGKRIAIQAHDGLGRPHNAEALVCGEEAFVEAASSCGLGLIAPADLDALAASSFGVGECIRQVLDLSCTRITVGIGGSCTNDGGMGCLRALGVRFLDAEGGELNGCGSDLARVHRIDTSGLHPAIAATSFVVMSDVTNPLLGPHGATHVFARQKGADDKTIAQLENGMEHYAGVVKTLFPTADFTTPGFGAAGGLGMALSVFLGARVESGIEELLRWIGFDAILQGADLVITGEGRLDEQSLHGKVVDGIAAHARRAGVPVAVICGTSSVDERELRRRGIVRVVEIAAGQSTERALAHATENYQAAARTFFATTARQVD